MIPIDYRCLRLRLVKLRRNEEFCFSEIANRHHLFFGDELRSYLRISHGIENLIFVVKAMLIVVTSMTMFATYRAKVEHSILFVKVVNRYFESQQFFSAPPVPKF